MTDSQDMSDNKVPTVITWHPALEAVIQPSRMYVPCAFVDDTLEQKLLTKENIIHTTTTVVLTRKAKSQNLKSKKLS